MQAITPYPRFASVFALCCAVGGAALTLGGCVSQQTYDTARHEVKIRAGELAQTQADIHSLEQERDAAHLANQRDERTLASLKNELKQTQASYDQLHKANQAKLALLEHNIATLRARHQAMMKEISETKGIEKRLEALTTLRDRTLATQQSGPEAQATPVDTVPQEPRMLAVITPPSSPAETFSALPPPAHTIPQASTTVSTSPAHPSTPAVAAPAAPNVPAKASQSPAAPPAPRPVPVAAPQDESWFSSMTGWLSSLIDWLWA